MIKKARVLELHSVADVSPQNEEGTIGVVESLEAREVVKLAHAANFSHIVQKNGLAFERELQTSQIMTENLPLFISDPMGVIFGSQETRAALRLSQLITEKKSTALEKFEEFLLTIKGARRIREPAMLVADELYTNAIKTGHSNGLTSPADLSAHHQTVEFFAEHDGERLVLGCRDSFGQLGFSQVLSRLTKCFESGVVRSINNGSGGAGIGSFMVFNIGVSYYGGVEKGRRTVVCVALPLGVSDSDLADMPKNIHLVAA